MEKALLLLLTLTTLFATVLSCGETLDPSGSSIKILRPIFRNVPQNPADIGVFQRRGVSFSLTVNGSFQAVETQTNKVLWVLNPPNPVNCAAKDNLQTGGCSTYLQGDGNFVFKDSYGVGYNSFNTYQLRANAFFVSSQPPYVYMQNSACTTTWQAGQGYDGDSSKGSTPIARTVPDPPYAPVTTTPTVQSVIPSGTWRNTLGACVHMNQGIGRGDILASLVDYMGGCCMRDGIPSDQAQIQNYLAAVQTGIKMNLGFYGARNKTTTEDLLRLLASATNFSNQAPAGTVRSFEGFNEVNNFPFVYNGVDFHKSYTGMFQAQKDVYSMVKSSPTFANTRVYDMTGAGFCPPNETYLALNYTGRADGGTIHPYPYGGIQALSEMGSTFLNGFADSYTTWDINTIKAATEDGYYTNYDSNKAPNGVSYAVQAVQVVNMILSAILNKFDVVYLYELNDQDYYSDPVESSFGIFMTNDTAKPVAHALHFLSQILFDGVNPDVSSSAGTVSFALSGLPGSCRYLVFKNANRNNWNIVIWNTVPLWNPQTGTQLSYPAGQTVTVQFANTMDSISMYDIYTNPASVVPNNGSGILQPSKTVTNANSMDFAMGTNAVVINFKYTPGSTGSGGSTGNGGATGGATGNTGSASSVASWLKLWLATVKF